MSLCSFWSPSSLCACARPGRWRWPPSCRVSPVWWMVLPPVALFKTIPDSFIQSNTGQHVFRGLINTAYHHLFASPRFVGWPNLSRLLVTTLHVSRCAIELSTKLRKSASTWNRNTSPCCQQKSPSSSVWILGIFRKFSLTALVCSRSRNQINCVSTSIEIIPFTNILYDKYIWTDILFMTLFMFSSFSSIIPSWLLFRNWSCFWWLLIFREVGPRKNGVKR